MTNSRHRLSMPVGLTVMTTLELLDLFAQVLNELRRRGITRSTNNPVADYAEVLFEKALSLTRTAKSTKGHDAVDDEGKRYEVKARRVTSHNRSRQLSAIRNLNQVHFAYLAGVLFREDFSVWKACLIPHDIVLNRSTYIAHTNSWKLKLQDDIWNLPGVIDVTEKLSHAQCGHI